MSRRAEGRHLLKAIGASGRNISCFSTVHSDGAPIIDFAAENRKPSETSDRRNVHQSFAPRLQPRPVFYQARKPGNVPSVPRFPPIVLFLVGALIARCPFVAAAGSLWVADVSNGGRKSGSRVPSLRFVQGWTAMPRVQFDFVVDTFTVCGAKILAGSLASDFNSSSAHRASLAQRGLS